MKETAACPAPPELMRLQSLGNFRRQKSQELIHRPQFASGIIEDAEVKVRGHFAEALRKNPVFGEYIVARTLRSIAFSAAFFNGATFSMNYVAPGLEAYNAAAEDKKEKGGTVEPFNPMNYFNPLPRLQTFTFETPQCQKFVKDLGGIILDWGEVGILDPSENDKPLADITVALHKRFVKAEKKWKPEATTAKDMRTFLTALAEDNAHAVLHTLIGLGGLTVHDSGSVPPSEEMALIALAHQKELAGFASTSRTFAQNHIRPEFAPDYRAVDVAAYEDALLTGNPMSKESTETYFIGYDSEGRLLSAHESLIHVAWDEPAMCPAFHIYNAQNHEWNKGNVSFIMQVAKMYDSEAMWLESKDRFSAAQVAINFGVLIGQRTIYPLFPMVVRTN